MNQKSGFPIFPMHFRGMLLLAGMYTIAWSAFFKWLGPPVMNWLSMGNSEVATLSSNYFGSFGLVIGLVIFVSAFYPVTWVWLILAGITGKCVTAIWFTLGFAPELSWNKRSVFHLVFNELIWLIPLILVFLRSLQVKRYLDQHDIEA